MPIGKVEGFQVGTQNWDTYVRRIKQFIMLNDIEKNLHVATLVTLVGSDCYDLMCDLCSPDQPEDKTFEVLVKLVKDHLEPERSEIAERHIFRQRKQQQGESVRLSSAELGMYFKRNGIKHLPVAPYHPSSNGAAENAVRTIKRVLKKASLENVNDNTALSKFLFMYRNTEHSATGREPAVAMFGRRLRGRLDLLRPDTRELVRGAQLAHEQRAAAARPPLRQADIGDAVIMRDYSKHRQKWAEGVVVRRSGPVTYAIKTNDGHLHKRHIDQLLTKGVRKSRCSITGPSPSTNMELFELEPNASIEQTQSTSSIDSPQSPPNTSYESKGKCPRDGSSEPVVTAAKSPPPSTSSPIIDSRLRRRAAIDCAKKLKTTK